MAKGYLAIELSASRIRFIFVDRDGQGFKVLKSGTSEYSLNIAAPGELTRVIHDIVIKENVSPQRLFVTLCRQGNFIRQMNMPKMNVNEMEEAISSEIEKLPLFSNQKFDYIYQVVHASKEKGSVVFAAVEQNVLNYIFDECEKLGIPFEHLEIAPLNLKEILPLIEPTVGNQALLVVNDQMTYLMIMRGRECKFIYQAGMGMEHLYPHRNNKVNEASLASLVGELQRVLKSYLSQNKTEKLQKLWFVWDNQGATGLGEIMAEQLGIDLDILSLNKVPQFQVNKDDQSANPIYVLFAAPLVIYLKKIKEQFALDHFFRALNLKKYVIRCATVTLIVVGVAVLVFGFKAFDYHQKQATLNNQIIEMSSEREQLKNSTQELYQQRDEYLSIRQGLLEQATSVKMLNRVSWSQVLSVVAEEMPENLGLTSFKFDEAGSVSFFGDALDVEVIAELIRRMDASTIVHEGKFDFLTEKTVDTQKIFSFGILAQLQPNSDEKDIGAGDKTKNEVGKELVETNNATELIAYQATKDETHE